MVSSLVDEVYRLWEAGEEVPTHLLAACQDFAMYAMISGTDMGPLRLSIMQTVKAAANAGRECEDDGCLARPPCYGNTFTCVFPDPGLGAGDGSSNMPQHETLAASGGDGASPSPLTINTTGPRDVPTYILQSPHSKGSWRGIQGHVIEIQDQLTTKLLWVVEKQVRPLMLKEWGKSDCPPDKYPQNMFLNPTTKSQYSPANTTQWFAKFQAKYKMPVDAYITPSTFRKVWADEVVAAANAGELGGMAPTVEEAAALFGHSPATMRKHYALGEKKKQPQRAINKLANWKRAKREAGLAALQHVPQQQEPQQEKDRADMPGQQMLLE